MSDQTNPSTAPDAPGAPGVVPDETNPVAGNESGGVHGDAHPEDKSPGFDRPEDERDFYCPGCGRRADYRRECTGSPAAPHPPIDVVSTDELYDGTDEADHTAAPAAEG